MVQAIAEEVGPGLLWLRAACGSKRIKSSIRAAYTESETRAGACMFEAIIPCEGFTTREQLQELVAQQAPSWRADGVLVLKTGLTTFSEERRSKAEGGLRLGDLAFQKYGRPIAPCCEWQECDTNNILTATDFARAALEMQEAVAALQEACACDKLDCFVEAVVAVAPAGKLRTLYAHSMDLRRVEGATLTPAGSMWGCQGISNATLLGSLRGMRGITSAVAIGSAAFTGAFMHPEDGGLTSLNLLLYGFPKVWYWVPSHKLDQLLATLETLVPKETKHAAAAMSCCKMLSLPAMTIQQAVDVGLRRFVQSPGDMICTAPVSTRTWGV